MKRETRTIEVMIQIYCKDHHIGNKELCEECTGLYGYALKKIERCSFKDNKPACSQCHIHCYEPAMRERIRQVMRYSGPKMPLRHPILAIRHLLTKKRKPGKKTKTEAKSTI